MAELRWILLGAGLALIAGLYLWGTRTRLRSAVDRVRPAVAPAPPAAPDEDARETVRIEPQVWLEPEAPGPLEPVPVIEVDSLDPIDAIDTVDEVEVPGGRREPTLGQRLSAPSERSTTVVREPPPSEDAESETQVEARAQRIVALRVVAPLPSRFEGSLLAEALAAERFEFGRYQIFHRNDESGRALISLASLREPGTFDPETMAGAAYAGVALFAVLPGPLPAQRAFEELLVASRSLAARLGGHVQDDRGVPLVAQRIARLREEMAAFDRGSGRR
jgi:cell division protein ZipA